jgi:hypothetical protein
MERVCQLHHMANGEEKASRPGSKATKARQWRTLVTILPPANQASLAPFTSIFWLKNALAVNSRVIRTTYAFGDLLA